MRVNRSIFAKLCLLTAVTVPVQPAVAATLSQGRLQIFSGQLLAQNTEAPEFLLPASLDGSEPLRIDGSASMRSMNEALIDQFQARYPTAEATNEASGSDAAIEQLQNGEVDLAAIGRPLTEEESEGLKAVAIAREKIAVITGPDNSFSGDITFEQFAQIFRGEITDWAELGGEPGPVRFVDRPDTSDTRRAFQAYPVFQAAPFVTGETADPVGVDETDAVVDALGNDGIGYAIASQVLSNGDVKIIPMHKTLPDNPAYPFSQPRNYVYLDSPSETVQGFLAVATGEEGQAAIAEVRDAETAAAANIEGPLAEATSPDGEFIARATEENVAVIEDSAGDLVAGPLLGAGGAVTALAFSEDGQTLATGTNTGNVRFWDLEGNALGPAFPAIVGADNAVTDLRFDEDDKLFVSGSNGRQGFWGLNGLPFGETDGSAAVGSTAAGSQSGGVAEDDAGLSPWLWLIPLLGLLGAGLWLLLGKKRDDGSAEAIRQTSPTATVPPPETDPATEREVSNRAHSVISTDRVTDESRPDSAVGATPPLATPLPIDSSATAAAGVDNSVTSATDLPPYESTDLEESPDLTGTNLDLIAATAGSTAAVDGMALSGLDAGLNTGVETNDEERDKTLDLALDDADQPAIISSEMDAPAIADVNAPVPDSVDVLEVDAPNVDAPNVDAPNVDAPNVDAPNVDTPEIDSTDTSSPDIDIASAVGGTAAVGSVALSGLGAGIETDDEEWDETLDLALDDNDQLAMISSEMDAPTIADVDAPELDSADTPSPNINTPNVDTPNINTPNINTFEPTRNTVIAETEIVLDIEPTRETIISDNTVIFQEPVATTASEPAVPESTVLEAAVSESSDPETAIESADPGFVGLNPAVEPNASDRAADLIGIAAAGLAIDAITSIPSEEIPSEETEPLEEPDVPTVASTLNSPIDTSTNMEETSPLRLEELVTVDDDLPDLPEGYGDSRIVLLPRDPKWAYAYWDVSNEHKEALRQQGGQRLMLRLYDVTDISISAQAPHSMQQQDCHEMARSWYLEVPVSDRDYAVEIGYLTDDERWLVLARSVAIRTPPIYPSDWGRDEFVTISWGESITGRSFGDLGQPYALTKADDAQSQGLPKVHEDLFAIAQSQDALRSAGSLYGSMQQAAAVPGALPQSGVPLSAVPDRQLGASGENVSGLNMSGVGLGGPALPERSHNFWLVANAELIVHGATEPDATLTIGGKVIPLNPDGTFRFHMAFPDGQIDYPIRAVAVDGEQTRSVHLSFERQTPERNTNTKAEAQDEWF